MCILILGPVILEDVLIEVFRTLYSQCKAELDLQMEPAFSKDHAQLSRWITKKLSPSQRCPHLLIFIKWTLLYEVCVLKE